jgi:hypothetical protein
MNAYTALMSFGPPGSLIYGYHRGDPVDAGVVENWGLTVGEEVVAGDLPADALPGAVMGKPDETATRVDWERYAVANGMSEDDASTVAIEDLQAVEPDEPEVVEQAPAGTERPADSDPKSDWVAYVVANGAEADKTWATQSSTTKANLQDWEPAGDPIAVDASERAND